MVAKTPVFDPTEAEVQKACLQWLNYQPGVKAWRQNTGAHAIPAVGSHKRRFIRAGIKGSADITGVAHGKRLEIEVKRRGKKPSPEQELWLSEMTQLGAIAFYVDSLDQLIEKWETRK